MIKLIYIRNEININELRTPIIPKDVKKLIGYGFTVYLESSIHRTYSDDDYISVGAKITTEQWYHDLFKNAIIIGLKELPYMDKLNKHTHIYFSHSFKNQSDSEKILKSFYDTNSVLYDFEYFTDSSGKRVISFGFYAGIVGCILSLLYFKDGYLKDLKPFESLESIKPHICGLKQLKINIIGPNGNCGLGVRSILECYNMDYDINVKDNLKNYDIVFNCIKLNENSSEVFDFDTSSKQLICDISCDYSKLNNPIKLYNKPGTWKTPIINVENIDILAIDNLPSLLPIESSEYFSSKFTELLLNYNNDYWKNALNSFNQNF